MDINGKSAGAYKAGGKLISSVNNASGKVITIVSDTIGQEWRTISLAYT
jgi:hypothetical protein